MPRPHVTFHLREILWICSDTGGKGQGSGDRGYGARWGARSVCRRASRTPVLNAF